MSSRLRNIKLFISIILFMCSTLIAQELKITVEEYKYLNESSSSIEDLVKNYHSKIIKNDTKGIFYFRSVKDNQDEENANTYFETETGYEKASIGKYNMQLSLGPIGWVGRQVGSNGYNVNVTTIDHTFVGRWVVEGFDFLVGLNFHSEPDYLEKNNQLYFTDNDPINRFGVVSNLIYYGIDIGLLINEFGINESVLSYTLSTDYGDFIPSIVYQFESFNFYDTNFNYDSEKFLKDYGLNISASIKYRNLIDNTEGKSGFMGSTILVTQDIIKIIRLSAGYSTTNEVGDEELSGYMFKAGVGLMDKSMTKLDISFLYYLGVSHNYYDDIKELQVINQDLALFGVEVTW
ncbi:hypothetical protein KKC15_06615 [bacterium]|nr:hypothetical protein [bacterium]